MQTRGGVNVDLKGRRVGGKVAGALFRLARGALLLNRIVSTCIRTKSEHNGNGAKSSVYYSELTEKKPPN